MHVHSEPQSGFRNHQYSAGLVSEEGNISNEQLLLAGKCTAVGKRPVSRESCLSLLREWNMQTVFGRDEQIVCRRNFYAMVVRLCAGYPNRQNSANRRSRLQNYQL